MKKWLIAFVLIIATALSASAEYQWYKATSYAYRYTNDYGRWTEWTDWMSCNISISFDMDDDVITIYGNKTQIYVITDTKGSGTDPSGGQYVSFRVIDQDYDYGTVRLRVETNGNSQIYVDFANVMWVYNVRRIR